MDEVIDEFRKNVTTSDNVCYSFSERGIRCVSNWLAVEPIDFTIKKTTKNNVAFAEQKVNLIKTAVVFGDNENKFCQGDVVYLHGNCIVNPVCKEVFEIDGKKFILVQKEWIRIHHSFH